MNLVSNPGKCFFWVVSQFGFIKPQITRINKNYDPSL